MPRYLDEVLRELHEDFVSEIVDLSRTRESKDDPFVILCVRAQEHCASLLENPDVCKDEPLLLARGLVTNLKFDNYLCVGAVDSLDHIPSWEEYKKDLHAMRGTKAGELVKVCAERKHLHESLSIALLLVLWYEQDQHFKTIANPEYGEEFENERK
ncbi:MAG: hypothetical protein KBD21_02970 [Candidatus Pacebacteria bacterium]|nr:hypothetical protein [Candidatus Paceibacterota bacterium]